MDDFLADESRSGQYMTDQAMSRVAGGIKLDTEDDQFQGFALRSIVVFLFGFGVSRGFKSADPTALSFWPYVADQAKDAVDIISSSS